MNLAFVRDSLDVANSRLGSGDNAQVVLVLEVLSDGLEIVNNGGRVNNATVQIIEINIGNV